MNDRPETGVGSAPIRPPVPKPGDRNDEKGYVWRHHKPGFEINQFGHLRTVDHKPPAAP